MGVILPFDQVVPALVTIATPCLYRQRNVGILFVLGSARLVCGIDHDLDLLILVEAPEAEGVEEGDLGDS